MPWIRSRAEMGSIAVMGTLDSKGEEHLFLREAVARRGMPVLTINIGTLGPPAFPPDLDLGVRGRMAREDAVEKVLQRAKAEVSVLQKSGEISGLISCGGGTGTHMATTVMRQLPIGFPKVMVSTVASRDLSSIVSTSDITMIHSVADLIGVNSVTGRILDQAAAAVCAMSKAGWSPQPRRATIAMTSFGFVTEAAQRIRGLLEQRGYEVVAFHANGTGGRAMEEMAVGGYFHGILDLALHELADDMMGGYCRGAGQVRLFSPPDKALPRLLIPGGLDCAVLEFTKDSVPERYLGRKLFFYDFRSAIGLEPGESARLGQDLARRLNMYRGPVEILVPTLGWSEADAPEMPLYDPESRETLLAALEKGLVGGRRVRRVQAHINEERFALEAVSLMEGLLQGGASA
jgi:uncharacterized protein (UPF0261 family)